MARKKNFASVIDTGVVLCLILVSVSSQDSTIYSNVKICSVRDPFINQCVQESANQMLQNLISGFRSLNFEPLDPMYIAEYALAPGNNLIPTWSFRSINNIQRGWKDAVIQHASVDPINRIFNFRFYIPMLTLNSRLITSGSLAGIPLEGDDDYEMIFKNLTFDVKFNGDLEDRNGQPYLVIKDFNQNTKVSGIQWTFKNLFNDPSFTKKVNEIFNDNPDFILSAIGQVPNVLFSQANQQIMQRILDSISYDQMFTDLPLEEVYS